MTRRLLLSLIAQYLRLPPGDASAREAFPYGRDILTASIGDHVFRLTPASAMATTRARRAQEAGKTPTG